MNLHDDIFANVLQFQFRQGEPGRATLRIVPARTFSDRDRRRTLARLAGKLDGRLAIDITTCDAIPLSPRGKATYVDQRIAWSDRCDEAPPGHAWAE